MEFSQDHRNRRIGKRWGKDLLFINLVIGLDMQTLGSLGRGDVVVNGLLAHWAPMGQLG